MYFATIFASTLAAVASAASIQVARQDSTCSFDLTQAKAGGEGVPAHFFAELNRAEKPVGSASYDFEQGGYPVVLRGYPEFLLIVKEDDDDNAALQFQYLAQKWTSADEQCTQSDYEGDTRNITCSFDC